MDFLTLKVVYNWSRTAVITQGAYKVQDAGRYGIFRYSIPVCTNIYPAYCWNLKCAFSVQFSTCIHFIPNLLILNITTQPLKQTHDFLFFIYTQAFFNATHRAAKPLHLSKEAGWKIEISAQPYVSIPLSDLMDRFTWPAPKVSMETKPISIELAVVSCSTVLGRTRPCWKSVISVCGPQSQLCACRKEPRRPRGHTGKIREWHH